MMLFALEHAGRGGERGPQFLLPLLLFFLIGFVVLRVIRHRRGGHDWQPHGSPMRTLEDRFAKGEIDREEFEHRKAVLDGADVVPPAPQPVATPPARTSETETSDAPDDVPGEEQS